MNQQPELFGEPPPRDKSLFLALFPDEVALEEIRRTGLDLIREQAPGSKLQALDRMHLTLHYLDDYSEIPAGLVAAVSRAAEVVGDLSRPFEVHLDRIANFGNPANPAVCLSDEKTGNPALKDFHKLLLGELVKQRCPIGKSKAFSPHLTMFYGKRGMTEQGIEPIGWTVMEFMLVCSHLGKGVYETLGSWRMGG